MITPKHALRDNEKFAVTVRYTATPFVPTNNVPFGFFTVNAGSVTAGQPNFSHTFYPVNDHPADKASYDISFDVPAGTDRGRQRRPRVPPDVARALATAYFMREPMASELIQLTVGAFDVIDAAERARRARARRVEHHGDRRRSSRRSPARPTTCGG